MSFGNSSMARSEKDTLSPYLAARLRSHGHLIMPPLLKVRGKNEACPSFLQSGTKYWLAIIYRAAKDVRAERFQLPAERFWGRLKSFIQGRISDISLGGASKLGGVQLPQHQKYVRISFQNTIWDLIHTGIMIVTLCFGAEGAAFRKILLFCRKSIFY